mmetsp:Transcript_50295/g.108345  ORF Transcript_50295/g.108345 Transcript_50295/m.108345 type:complete len:92 (+) Transcript_50295:26-301(+)
MGFHHVAGYPFDASVASARCKSASSISEVAYAGRRVQPECVSARSTITKRAQWDRPGSSAILKAFPSRVFQHVWQRHKTRECCCWNHPDST